MKTGNRRTVHRYITTFLQLIMVGGMVWSILSGALLNVFLIGCIILLTMWPLWLGKRFEIYIPPELEMFACLFIFSSLFLGEFGDFYHKFWWWDVVLHGGSAMLLGVVGFLIVFISNQSRAVDLQLNPLFVALFSFVMTVALGAEWEVFEFIMDQSFGMNMQKSGLVDTMWDLIVDTGGALVVSVLGYAYLKYERKSFVERWIVTFMEKNPQLFQRSDS